MKYVVIMALLISGFYIGMTQLALEAVQSIRPYYENADAIAQQSVRK